MNRQATSDFLQALEMAEEQGTSLRELWDYSWRVLRKRWLLIIAVTLLFTAGAVVYLVMRPRIPVYRASATIIILAPPPPQHWRNSTRSSLLL